MEVRVIGSILYFKQKGKQPRTESSTNANSPRPSVRSVNALSGLNQVEDVLPETSEIDSENISSGPSQTILAKDIVNFMANDYSLTDDDKLFLIMEQSPREDIQISPENLQGQ